MGNCVGMADNLQNTPLDVRNSFSVLPKQIFQLFMLTFPKQRLIQDYNKCDKCTQSQVSLVCSSLHLPPNLESSLPQPPSLSSLSHNQRIQLGSHIHTPFQSGLLSSLQRSSRLGPGTFLPISQTSGPSHVTFNLFSETYLPHTRGLHEEAHPA